MRKNKRKRQEFWITLSERMEMYLKFLCLSVFCGWDIQNIILWNIRFCSCFFGGVGVCLLNRFDVL